MKIEKTKQPQPPRKYGSVANLLRQLRPGEVLRITTAREARSIVGCMGSVYRKTGKQFSTQLDGDDVLVFLRK